MKDYELRTCEALQHDIKSEFNNDWDIETIYNFWSAWSEYCFAGWLEYTKGDVELLNQVVETMWNENFGNTEVD